MTHDKFRNLNGVIFTLLFQEASALWNIATIWYIALSNFSDIIF